jgi:hypothetical protein
MNKLIIAFGITLVAATSALAQSSILDVMKQEPVTSSQSGIVAGNGASAYDFSRGRLGDGSPAYVAVEGTAGVDNTATASIGNASAYDFTRGRLGDGSPE